MGTPCRRSSGECDLTEYCTGETGDCPPNLFLKNGIPCNNGQVGQENFVKLNVYFIFHDVLAVISLHKFQGCEGMVLLTFNKSKVSQRLSIRVYNLSSDSECYFTLSVTFLNFLANNK